MSESFYDLVKPGMVLELGSHTFTRDEIVEFAQEFDPQRFHLSEEDASSALFGALCASGWHTIAVWMRHNVDNRNEELIRLTGYDGQSPVFGASPGVRNIKWLRPVYVGDTITYRKEMLEKKVSKKREGWGMLINRSTAWNQDGKQVLSLDGAVTLRID